MFSRMDCFSVFGKSLDSFKKEIDFKIRIIADDYDKKKEEYDLYISSLLGYGAIKEDKTNEILKIEDLWNYKFGHIADLRLIVDEIKNLNIKAKDGSVKVEILKKASEHFGAINMKPSCMAPGGKYDQYAFTIVEGPILIIGVKDDKNKVIGRSLLIPVQKENKEGKKQWYFELKDSYGAGKEEVEEFCQKIEEALEKKDSYKEGEKIIYKKFIKGDLPSKKGDSNYFFRDGIGLTELDGIG